MSDSMAPKSIFAKPPIKVIVGSEDRVYYVHHGALEAHPAFEEKLMSSTDDYDHPIDWCAFDEQTIECVLGFLYTGDYQAPEIAEVVGENEEADAGEEVPAEEEEEEVAEEVEEAEEEGEEEPISPSSTNSPSPAFSECDPNDRPLTPLGNCCGIDLPEYAAFKTPETEKQEEPAPEVKESAAAEIYLHTKVYSFAHQFEFSKLEQFSLNCLAKVLVNLEQSEKDLFPYLADGIRLIYTTTETTNDARNLLSQFVAFKYTTIIGEEFDKLITEGGEFMVDVSRKLARKLTSLSSTFQEKIEDLVRVNEELNAEIFDKDRRTESLKEEVRQWVTRRNGPTQKYPAFTYEI